MSLDKLSLILACSMFLACSISPRAGAEVLLHDQFVEDGILAGKVPSPGPGTAWNPGSATGVNAVAVVNGAVGLLQTDGGVNGEDIANVFANQADSATTYARFDFRLPSIGNETLAADPDVIDEGVFFVTLRGTSASTSQRARFGILDPVAGGDYRVAINADSSNLALGGVWDGDLLFDTTYRSVISYNAGTGESRLWLDPTNETSTSVAHTGATATIINRVILRQNNDYAGFQWVDNLVVANSFADALTPPALGGLAGDYNGDLVVDAADYTVWRNHLGSDFDLNGNGDETGDSMGTVDGADYDLWKLHYGETSVGEGGIASRATPEPTAVGLLFTGVAVATCFRRRRSR